MYGLDNFGNIKANSDKLYYLKDHLGTVRAVLDTTNTVVAAYDYDPWGYPLSNRTYEASSSVDQKYKFTSKQRDKESGINGKNGYDYFPACRRVGAGMNFTSNYIIVGDNINNGEKYQKCSHNIKTLNNMRIYNCDTKKTMNEVELLLTFGELEDLEAILSNSIQLNREEYYDSGNLFGQADGFDVTPPYAEFAVYSYDYIENMDSTSKRIIFTDK